MDDKEKLKLGKGVGFVKSRLKRLPQGDDTREADFEALPQPIMQTETHYYPGNKEGHIPTQSASEGPLKSSESRRGSPLDD